MGTKGEMIVREAEEKDIHSIAELDKLCFGVPWSEESFRYEILNNDLALYIVAEIDETVVGYAGMWIILDEGHITNVGVHPSYRGKSIGEALVSVILSVSESEGVLRQTLEVRETNQPAIGLYTKFGFVPEGIRKGYYEDNKEDAIIMWRNGYENV